MRTFESVTKRVSQAHVQAVPLEPCHIDKSRTTASRMQSFRTTAK